MWEEGGEEINANLCRKSTKSFNLEISDGFKCSPTMHSPVASAALPLNLAALQPAFAFPPAA